MTIRSFALEISPFYEWMLFCIQLILCWGSKPRRYGISALIVLGTIYILLPWRIEQFHRLNIFLIGNISVGHSVMSFISIIIFFSCFHISWQRAILQGAITNILQFLWFIITIQFFILIPQVQSFWRLYAIALQAIVFAFVVFFFRNAISWEQTDRMDKGRLIAIFLSVMIIIMLLYADFNEKLKDMGGSLIYLLWGILLYVLLYSVLSADKLQQEKELMEKLLYESEKSHAAAMQSAEIINQKCHDLKHQIHLLQTVDDYKRDVFISELERSVMIYESVFHTGNATLDVLLGEKKLLCDQKKVDLSMIGDASGLCFIAPIDLYTLFANALDNAIEAASNEEQGNKLISVNIARRGTITSIHIENTASQSAEFVNGLPVTNKSDKVYHGIGTRSMRSLVEKYGGVIEFSQRKGFFIIDILFSGQVGNGIA